MNMNKTEDVYELSNLIIKESKDLNKLVCDKGYNFTSLITQLNKILSSIESAKAIVIMKNESLKHL